MGPFRATIVLLLTVTTTAIAQPPAIPPEITRAQAALQGLLHTKP